MPPRLARPLPLLSLVLLLAAMPLRAQQTLGACDREATTSFRFGLTGGNLEPSATEITAKGEVRRRGPESAGPTLGHVPRDSVRALAMRGWRGGFGGLPPAPRRPTANPDAARKFIELHSACGMHHVEYGPGTESPLFNELYARLTRLASRRR